MFKKNYTPEDIKSIHDWFEAHKEQMPDTLQLDAATYYKNLKSTVKTYFEVFDLYGSNPTFSGQYHQLWLIKAKLEEMGIKWNARVLAEENAANIRPRNKSETADRKNGLAKKRLSLCLFCD